MLDLNLSFVRQSRMMKFASSVAQINEGMALVRGLEGGVEVCMPATGATSEKFVGLAVNNRKTPTVLTAYEEVLVPATAPFTVTLLRAPLGNLGLRSLTTDQAELLDSTGAFAAANDYNISGRTLSFPAGVAGQTFRVSYTYSPTVLEVQAYFGQTDIGEDASGVVGGTGVFFEADSIFTSYFDPTSDWWGNISAPIYTAAGGYLSLNPATGSPLPDGCYIVSAPSTVSPLLGIRLKA